MGAHGDLADEHAVSAYFDDVEATSANGLADRVSGIPPRSVHADPGGRASPICRPDVVLISAIVALSGGRRHQPWSRGP